MEQAHADEKFALHHHIAVLKEKQELTMEDAQAEYERQREILSSEHLENFHQLQSQMDAKLQALSDRFEDEHTAYITNTDERTQVYKGLMLRDKTLIAAVESRKERVKRLKHSVVMWKTKLVNGNRDEQRRNEEMEEAKAGVLQQYRALKSRMRQLHAVAERRLKRMALGAGHCKSALAEQTATAERILRLQERARRLESTVEKIAPFHDPKGIRPSNRLAELADTMSAGLEQMSIGSGASWRSIGRGGGEGRGGGAGEQKDAQPVLPSGAPAAPLVTGPGISTQPSVASVGSELWDNAPEGPPSPVQEPGAFMRAGRAGSGTEDGTGGPGGSTAGRVRLGVGLSAGSTGGDSHSGSGLASGMGSPVGRLEGPSSGRGSPVPVGIVSFEAISSPGGTEGKDMMDGGEGARDTESKTKDEKRRGGSSSGANGGATAAKQKPTAVPPSSSSASFGIAGAARRSRRLGSMALSHEEGLDGAALVTQKALRDGLPPVLARTTALRKADQGAVGQENLLDGFYGRYNRALVDKLALEKHLEGLKQENRKLKELARQHLEGVSLGPGALEGPNPLFVVNGRSSLVERQPTVGQRPRSAVDGAATMRSVAKMTSGVRAAVRG